MSALNEILAGVGFLATLGLLIGGTYLTAKEIATRRRRRRAWRDRVEHRLDNLESRIQR